jgi:hypothetical protein
MMMASKSALQLRYITVDCADPVKVSAFWSAALGRTVDDGANESFASIGGSDDSLPGWYFVKVPEGKAAKNRMHVDLRAEDRDAAVAHLLALGATHHRDYDEGGAQWTTLLDVEGNEFCVI